MFAHRRLWGFNSLIFARCLILVVGLSILFSLLTPYFLSLSNLDNILAASAVVGLLALGGTFVIASGEIDLSVASVMALSGIVAASVSRELASPLVTLLAGAATGWICGSVTAVLINITRAPSFIITLGMLSVARALAYIISSGLPIYGLPDEVTVLGQGQLLGISGPVIFLALAALVLYVLLHFTRFGSRVLIAGDNSRAARAMGINLSFLRFKIFSLAGLLSGIAGFVFMARTNCGDPNAGLNYELTAITAIVLGGTKLFGGRAHIIGTLLGVYALGVLQNGLNLLAVSTYYQVLFVGFVLISAAFLDRGEERV